MSILLGCTKEDSFYVPLHANSYAWLMENKTHIYTNSKGDSLVSTKIEETQSEERELNLPGYPDGTTGETYRQVITIDTLFDYSTLLLTEIDIERRNDKVWIDGLGIEMFGNAEPFFALSASYSDTLSINGIEYYNVFHNISSSLGTGIYVNVSNGLVAFIAEKDTFNLVN